MSSLCRLARPRRLGVAQHGADAPQRSVDLLVARRGEGRAEVPAAAAEMEEGITLRVNPQVQTFRGARPY